jgi:hypothetical protein
MRGCGVCRFGGFAEPRGCAPSAACVLVSGGTRLEGALGILAGIEAAAAGKHVGLASAYCKRCRRITWLCREDSGVGDVGVGDVGVGDGDVSAACVDFWWSWRATESIDAALRIVQERNGPKKRRLCRGNAETHSSA